MLRKLDSVNFNLSPFGQGRVTEILHEGKIFNLYRVNLCGQDVVLKTPSLHSTGSDLYGITIRNSSEAFVDTNQGLDQLFAHPSYQLDAIKIATDILLIESQIINWTAGAWNHKILGIGTWDGLSNCHYPETAYQDEALDRRFLPVLIMPYYPAIPFSKLPTATQKNLFPKILPSLWDALCCVHHGDLSESNLLINQNQAIFHLIDPSVLLWSRSEQLFSNREISIFTTTAANYPIFPPYMSRFADIGIVETIRNYANSFELENKFSCRIPAQALSAIQPKLKPSIPDLLAIGIMYYRIVTGEEFFLGQPILPDKPAWQNSYVTPDFKPYWIYAQLADRLSNNYIQQKLSQVQITQPEKQLISALLQLDIKDKNYLLKLICNISK